MNIELVKGDITKIDCDAIVNCGTAKIVIGGGAVSTAIFDAAGPGLMQECRRIMDDKKSLAIGEALVTGAYKLRCKKVIHTAGPIYLGGLWNEAANLGLCYSNALYAADEALCESIAFPNICAGSHTYPKKPAAEIAVSTVRDILPKLQSVKRVVFVCFEDENYVLYKELLDA
ncbi:MAG: macro domain-containing protein [Spirochaetaceae bacterium]|jgi:O-acetyl-ADP-ribose deacetylase (regulator of RNase III)|nr:macro domain-containing protein [Spirochaetaceae bacterium]